MSRTATAGAWILAVLVLPRVAVAQDDTWWIGRPVADVQLRAPEGGLPEESLEPLLQVRAGHPLAPLDVRDDLATLFQVGQFASVEADVEPWPFLEPDGTRSDGVVVNYVVYPAPRIQRVRVEGEHHEADRVLLEVANLARGQVFYPDLDGVAAERAVEQHLYRLGWTRAEVRVTSAPREDGQLEVTLTVVDGEPNTLERLSFAGDLAAVFPSGGDRLLYRWAARAGVVEGAPFAPEALARAQQAIRHHLASMRRGPFRQRYGWVGARVTPAVLRTPAGATRVTYTIEPGARLDLDVAGLDWRARRKVQEALGIDERLRLTRGWLDDAPERLEETLAERGWFAADVRVALEDTAPGEQTLRVDVDPGPRHVLRTGLPPGWVGIDFQGNDTLTDADLQRVVDQASVDVVRRDFYTEAELGSGLAAARDLYRARGYGEAELTIAGAEVAARRFGPGAILGAPIRAVSGRARRRIITPHVVVTEGPLTLLDSSRIVGATDEVDLGPAQEALDALAGSPLSPQRLEIIHRQLLEAQRAAGHLEADGRVRIEPVEPLLRTATLEIDPGPLVTLRSIVTRGPRSTRPSFLRREVASLLTIGAPLTGAELEQLRAALYDLGIFRSVQLSLIGEAGERDLVLDVTERGRWDYELGAGLSTDQGVRTFGRITRRNLWGLAHRLDLVGQVGLVWRSESLQDWVPDISDPTWRVAMSYTAPRFPTRHQDLVVDALLRELRQERTWRLARSGGGVAIEHQLGESTDLRVGARIETRQLQEVDLGALLPGEPWTALLTDGLPPSAWRVQESVTAIMVHDRRDDPVSPSRGVLVSANGEWAPGLAWGDQPRTAFVKGDARISAYVPMGGPVLRATLEGARAVSLNAGILPLEDRYRLGGTGSLRGFRRDAVGPYNQASRLDFDWPDGIDPLIAYTVRDDPDRWVPTGGDTSALGIFEWILPLPVLGLTGWDGYAVALFADIGNVWLLHARTVASDPHDAMGADAPWLRVGTGLGVRVATPVGPLQLDLGLNPQAIGATGTRRSVLLDAWDEPRFRAHLTLGALF